MSLAPSNDLIIKVIWFNKRDKKARLALPAGRQAAERKARE